MFQICFICAVQRVVSFIAVMFMAPEVKSWKLWETSSDGLSVIANKQTSCRRILKKTGGFLKAVYVL